jgi:hypothetical protein
MAAEDEAFSGLNAKKSRIRKYEKLGSGTPF